MEQPDSDLIEYLTAEPGYRKVGKRSYYLYTDSNRVINVIPRWYVVTVFSMGFLGGFLMGGAVIWLWF